MGMRNNDEIMSDNSVFLDRPQELPGRWIKWNKGMVSGFIVFDRFQRADDSGS